MLAQHNKTSSRGGPRVEGSGKPSVKQTLGGFMKTRRSPRQETEGGGGLIKKVQKGGISRVGVSP